jgi:hypothetical protein
MRVFVTACVLASPIATPAIAADTVDNAVQVCIQVTHKSGYPYFDAFYNPATKRVENNISLAYQQPALFYFNKCMASQGFPLSYEKNSN